MVDPQQIWHGGVSECRNPALQRLFSFLQLGEREGSGGPAMRQAWSQQHWRSPMLREDAAHSETHLTLTMESLLPEAKQPSSRRDLQGALKLRHEEHFRLVYLLPALAAGLIEMTIPDKPTSRLQKYRLTDTGRQLLERF